MNDVFYKTMVKLAHEKGCKVSAESVAPTMMSDGMLHYSNVDIPMGEFWLRSPTHDKPNDMLDAISGAHIYGKNIVQAEGFTELRMAWDEHPGMLKRLGDRNFALGVNRLVFHVFTHNPWMDKKPGMTLDGVGLYFQRDQTWFKQSKAWVDYITRCQTLLQFGKPVVDVAVFTGEELPRRALTPDRLVSTLPGIFGRPRVALEEQRLANEGQPLRTIPDGVTHSANMADPENYIDPLHGYAYDSFNPDVFTKAKVKNKKIELPSGASYGLLVIPQTDIPFSPVMDQKLKLWRSQGLNIINKWEDSSFAKIGLQRDIEIRENDTLAENLAWNHRSNDSVDIYFISNQKNKARQLHLSCRVSGRTPQLWDPLSGQISDVNEWRIQNNRTSLWISMDAEATLFVVFRKPANSSFESETIWASYIKDRLQLRHPWTVSFDSACGGPVKPVVFDSLYNWTKSAEPAIKYYSGTALYKTEFKLDKLQAVTIIDLGDVANLATVKVNGIDCGTAWAAPYKIDISKAVKSGNNELKIEVTNTWRNRLIGEQLLPLNERITSTTSPYRLEGKPLLKAGLIGPVIIIN